MPVDGSSSSTTGGAPTSAAPTLRRRRLPPEYCPAGRSAIGASPRRDSSGRDAAATAASGTPRRRAKNASSSAVRKRGGFKKCVVFCARWIGWGRMCEKRAAMLKIPVPKQPHHPARTKGRRTARHRRRQAVGLRAVPESAPRGAAARGRVGAGDEHAARIGHHLAGDDLERRRLAGAVGALGAVLIEAGVRWEAFSVRAWRAQWGACPRRCKCHRSTQQQNTEPAEHPEGAHAHQQPEALARAHAQPQAGDGDSARLADAGGVGGAHAVEQQLCWLLVGCVCLLLVVGLCASRGRHQGLEIQGLGLGQQQ